MGLKMNFQVFKEFFSSYFANNQTIGLIKLIVDAILVIILIIGFFFLIKKKINFFRLGAIIFSAVLLFFVSLYFGLSMVNIVIKNILFWTVGIFAISYVQDIKGELEGRKEKNINDSEISAKKEKAEIISSICNAIANLMEKRYAALITFERKDSLESIISRSIPINADITQEIITTIFEPETACNNGGIIIQNNKILCAGAYYTLTNNNNIPKDLGTRHRAAIGLSEQYDAVTIVISSKEKTSISIAAAGEIQRDLSIEEVRTLLDGYLSMK